MRGPSLAALMFVILAVGTAPVTSIQPTDAPAARIVGVYPNPVLPNDAGEYVVLSIPSALSGVELILSDGENDLSIRVNGSVDRLVVGTDPIVNDLTDAPVLLIDQAFRLSNAGERLVLRIGDRVVSTVTYPRAPEGAIYRRTDSGWEWTRPGATDFEVWTSTGERAQLFVLPDTPEVVFETLEAAESRLWLAAYTLTSPRVASLLCAVHRRGVDVRVLADLEPVSGISVAGAHQFDRLAACGVRVQVIGGPHARYAFHHAKYAIVDDRAIILTENWKPSGVGGLSSRGWGAVVESAEVSDHLATVFEADSGWRDVKRWEAARVGREFTRTEPPANGTYPTEVAPVTVAGVDVEVIVAPENAEARVIELLDSATESIEVIQVSVGGPSQPFVRALLRAAERGVEVRLLVASAWYVAESNAALAEALNQQARTQQLPLEVRIATPRGRYDKIHAKGVVVDGETALVGSLNWNNASARLNREVAVVLHGADAASYFAAAFDADWNGGQWRIPVALPVTAAGLALLGTVIARRTISFAAEPERVASVDESESPFETPY